MSGHLVLPRQPLRSLGLFTLVTRAGDRHLGRVRKTALVLADVDRRDLVKDLPGRRRGIDKGQVLRPADFLPVDALRVAEDTIVGDLVVVGMGHRDLDRPIPL